jgi:hypothetical protein
MPWRRRRFIYEQAEYLAHKYYFVHVHELPDARRRKVLKVARGMLEIDK